MNPVINILAQSLPTEHEPAPPVPDSLVMDLEHRLTIAREALSRLDEICSEKDGIRVFKVSGPMIKRITAEALTLTAPRP